MTHQELLLELGLTPYEINVLEGLATHQQMSITATLRQALRLYQCTVEPPQFEEWKPFGVNE